MGIINNHRFFLIMESLLWLILGSLAVALPMVMTVLNIPLFLGILFIILAAWQVLRCVAWQGRAGGWVPTLINLIAYIVFGSILIGMNFEGTAAPTVVISFMFFFDGITKMVIGNATEASGWFAYSGMFALFFGFSIWFVQMGTELRITSVFVGSNMLIFGAAIIGSAIFSEFGKRIP